MHWASTHDLELVRLYEHPLVRMTSECFADACDRRPLSIHTGQFAGSLHTDRGSKLTISFKLNVLPSSSNFNSHFSCFLLPFLTRIQCPAHRLYTVSFSSFDTGSQLLGYADSFGWVHEEGDGHPNANAEAADPVRV